MSSLTLSGGVDVSFELEGGCCCWGGFVFLLPIRFLFIVCILDGACWMSGSVLLFCRLQLLRYRVVVLVVDGWRFQERWRKGTVYIAWSWLAKYW